MWKWQCELDSWLRIVTGQGRSGHVQTEGYKDISQVSSYYLLWFCVPSTQFCNHLFHQLHWSTLHADTYHIIPIFTSTNLQCLFITAVLVLRIFISWLLKSHIHYCLNNRDFSYFCGVSHSGIIRVGPIKLNTRVKTENFKLKNIKWGPIIITQFI
jgi:hypothetical protein